MLGMGAVIVEPLRSLMTDTLRLSTCYELPHNVGDAMRCASRLIVVLPSRLPLVTIAGLDYSLDEPCVP